MNFFTLPGDGHFTDVLKAFYEYHTGRCLCLNWADSTPVVIERSPRGVPVKVDLISYASLIDIHIYQHASILKLNLLPRQDIVLNRVKLFLKQPWKIDCIS